MAVLDALCNNYYATVPYQSWGNTGKYPDLKWCLLIQQIQIKEYILETLAPKREFQNLDLSTNWLAKTAKEKGVGS